MPTRPLSFPGSRSGDNVGLGSNTPSGWSRATRSPAPTLVVLAHDVGDASVEAVEPMTTTVEANRRRPTGTDVLVRTGPIRPDGTVVDT